MVHKDAKLVDAVQPQLRMDPNKPVLYSFLFILPFLLPVSLSPSILCVFPCMRVKFNSCGRCTASGLCVSSDGYQSCINFLCGLCMWIRITGLLYSLQPDVL
jgi:hypothetical protein